MELQQIKYNQLLPPSLHGPLVDEMNNWKKELLNAFLECKQSTPINWSLAHKAVRVFYRFSKKNLGYHFSNDEKKVLTEQVYELLIHPTASLDVQQRLAGLLVQLLSNKDIQNLKLNLPWMPLYQILVKTYFKKNRTLQFGAPELHGQLIIAAIAKIRKYFSSSNEAIHVVDEILNEFRPKLCIHDHWLHISQGFICLFLPTQNTEKITGHLNELIGIWDLLKNAPLWDRNFFNLMKRIAYDQIGKIDLTPYFPFLFTRALRAIDLPVAGQSGSRYNNFPGQNCSLFCSFGQVRESIMDDLGKFFVWILSPTPSGEQGFQYLEQLLRSIEQYFYPSNAGNWTSALARLLHCICQTFARRILKEKSEDYHVPKEYRLNQELIDRFVNLVRPLAVTSIYSKSPNAVMLASASLKHLAFVNSDTIVPILFEKILPNALTTVTDVHQTSASIELLSLTIVPILNHYSKKVKANQMDETVTLLQQNLEPILSALLPALDYNDTLKTWVTMKCLAALFSVMPLSIEQESHDFLLLSNAFVEEFCLHLLDKIFHYLSHVNQSDTQTRMDQSHQSNTFNGSGSAGMMGDNMTSFEPMQQLRMVLSYLFQQASPSLHSKLHGKILQFVKENTLFGATNYVADLMSSACIYGSKSHEKLYPFVQWIHKQIMQQQCNTKEWKYYLQLLNKILKNNSGAYACRTLVEEIIFKALQEESLQQETKVMGLIGKILKHFVYSCSNMYVMEFRLVNEQLYHSKVYATRTVEFVGQFSTIDYDKVQPSWFIPQQEHLQYVMELYHKWSEPLYTNLSTVIQQQQSTIDSKKVTNWLQQLRYLLRAYSILLPNPIDTTLNVENNYTRTTLHESPIMIPIHYLIQSYPLQIVNTFTREGWAQVLHPLSALLMKHCMDETNLLKLICKTMYSLICYRFCAFGKWSSVNGASGMVKRLMYLSCNEKSFYPRHVLLSKAQIQIQGRFFFRVTPYHSTMHTNLLQDLLALSTNSLYSKVRSKAQAVFVNVTKLFHPRLAKQVLLPQVLQILSKGKQSTDAELNGALFILTQKSIQKRLLEDWKLIGTFFVSICKAIGNVEKPSIQQRLQNLFYNYGQFFKELPLQSKETETQYLQIIQELTSLFLEQTGSNWKMQLSILTCLILFVRSDCRIYFPLETITKVFVPCLQSDVMNLRNGALKALSLLFTQYRPLQPKQHQKPMTPLEFEEYKTMPILTLTDHQHALYFDKNYFGYYVLPVMPITVYDYSQMAQRQQSDLLRQQLVPLFSANQFEYWKKVMQRFQTHDQHVRYNDTYAQFFKGLFQICNTFAFAQEFYEQVLKPYFILKKEVYGTGSPEEMNHVALVCEWLGGLLRATKHWSFEERNLVIQQLAIPLLKDFLFTTVSFSASFIVEQCIQFCVYDLDIRRVDWLRQVLFENVNLQTGTATQQAKTILLLLPCLSEMSWRASKQVYQQLWNKLVVELDKNPYQQVRDAISAAMVQVFKTQYKMRRDEKTQLLWYSDTVQETKDEMLLNCFTQIQRIMDSVKLESIQQSQFLSPDNNNTNNNTNYAHYITLGKTVLKFAHSLCIAGTHYIAPYLDQLIPLLATISNDLSQTNTHITPFTPSATPHTPSNASSTNLTRESLIMSSSSGSLSTTPPTPSGKYMGSNTPHGDQELESMIKETFTFLAQHLYPLCYVDTISQSIEMILLQNNMTDFSVNLQSSNWRMRLAVLLFIQSFGFLHSFHLMNPLKDDQRQFQNLLTLLRDGNVEVRHLSMLTLSGFIKIAHKKRVEQLVAYFSDLAQQHLNQSRKKKQQQQQQTFEEVTKTKAELNFTVLGLSSIIRAFPYQIPTFLPEVLVLLAKLLSIITDQQLVQSVRKTFAEFKRTHQAEWNQVHKQHFTDDQLVILNDLLVSQNYYL